MITKQDIVYNILQNKPWQPQDSGHAFAPSNIALCKYWGKRNQTLNLPMTSSLSISLGEKGSKATITILDKDQDDIYLNDKQISNEHNFAKKLIAYLDLFRTEQNHHFHVDTHSNIPIAAGLASSASGFASIIMALNDLFQWQCTQQELSILARLGSGSACRSVYQGFVEWQCGTTEDGMDSYAIPLDNTWPELRIGLLIFSAQQKPISSRQAMQQTIETSKLYQAWPDTVVRDFANIKQAIHAKDFQQLGYAAETNALAMHATMQAAWPPIMYSSEQTIAAMNKVWQLRQEGIEVYFTQDAGPNLKLLFLQKDKEVIEDSFIDIETITVFKHPI